jgi:hypothetical protein
MRFCLRLLVLPLACVLALPALAANNPVPQIDIPLAPAAAAPGGAGFSITIHGAGFVSGSVVNWNGGPRTTTFVSAGTITAAILAADIATSQTAVVTVRNPSPGGGLSNPAYFEVTTPQSSIAMSASVIPQADITGLAQPLGLVPSTIAVSDFNGDGKLDIALLTGVLLGNGDGTFQSLIAFPSGVDARSLAAADVNNDGKLDLVVENTGFTFTVLLGNGDGSFQSPLSVSLPNDGAQYDFVLGDFNGDGKLDLAAVGPTNPNLNIYPGNGDGTFGAAFFSATLTGGNSLAAADLNGDGKLDLAFCDAGGHNGGPLTVFLGNGNGTFQPPNSTGSCNTLVAFADVNGDGKLDELTWGFFSPNPGSISVFSGNGDGTFQSPQNLGAGLAAVADLDGDGKLDLFARNPQSSTQGGPDPAGLGVFLGNGNATFQAESFVAANAGVPLYASGSGDFNGDGKMDVLAVDHVASPHLWVVLQSLAPAATPSPDTVSFGNLTIGVASSPQTVTLTNSGTAPLNISGVTVDGADAAMFMLTHACSSTLAAGASCSVQVVFTPAKGGARNATLKFADNALGGSQLVPLSGTGQDFSISTGGSSSATVTPGQTASYTVSIAPVAGFNQSVTLACTGAPAMSTCSASPSSVTLDGTSTATAMVSVTTTASGSLVPLRIHLPLGTFGGPSGVILLAIAFLVLRMSPRWPNQRFRFAPAFALALVCLALTFTSCGGGGSGGTQTVGTPAGTYSLTISATAGSSSSAVTHTGTLTLIVR